MPFKSKAQIFGDDGPNGLAVPVSTTNSAGTAAANRGIGFGEGLTAAIANRAAGALADNTDDLNARLVDMETGGLDGAYRPGGIAGDGRIILADGGAVEVVNTTPAEDETRAAVRARITDPDDTAFEAVGNGFAFQHRSVMDFSGDTVLAETGVAATLNDAGAGVDRVTIGGGNRFQTSGSTELLFGYDLLVITDAGVHNGVYLINTLSGDFEVGVVGLDGAVPSFPVSTAATVFIHRLHSLLSDDGLRVGKFLHVLHHETQTSAQGRLLVEEIRADGTARRVFYVPEAGGLQSEVKPSLMGVQDAAVTVDLIDDPDITGNRGVMLERVLGRLEYTRLSGIAEIVTPTPRFMNFIRGYERTLVDPGANRCALPAAVTLYGSAITFSSDNTAGLIDIGVGAIVRLSDSDHDGYYRVFSLGTAGNGSLNVRDLKGDAPTLSGAGTAHIILPIDSVFDGDHPTEGQTISWSGSSQAGQIFGSGTTTTGMNRRTRGAHVHAGSLIVAAPRAPDGTNNTGLDAVFAVNGERTACRHFLVRSKTSIFRPATEIISRTANIGDFNADGGWPTYTTGASGEVRIVVNPDLALGPLIALHVRVVPGAARATVGQRIQVRVRRVTTNTTTGVMSLSPDEVVTDNGTTAAQRLTVDLTDITSLDAATYLVVHIIGGATAGSDEIDCPLLEYNTAAIGPSYVGP